MKSRPDMKGKGISIATKFLDRVALIHRLKQALDKAEYEAQANLSENDSLDKEKHSVGCA